MKRLFTCAALMLIAAVAGVVLSRWEASVARADDSTQPGYGSVDPVNGAGAKSGALRERYLEQLKAKAALMSDDEIKAALDATTREVRELEAKKEVTEISEALAAVAKKYEGTQAAAVAEQMIQTYHNGASAGGNAPYYGPTSSTVPYYPATPSQLPTY